MKNKKENKYILGMSKYFPILLIATCVLIVCSILWLFTTAYTGTFDSIIPQQDFTPYESQIRGSLGALGDYFGGILNPIFSFVTILLLLISLFYQRKELRLTREELAKSSVALSKTESHAAAQSEIAKKQLDHLLAQENNKVICGLVEHQSNKLSDLLHKQPLSVRDPRTFSLLVSIEVFHFMNRTPPREIKLRAISIETCVLHYAEVIKILMAECSVKAVKVNYLHEFIMLVFDLMNTNGCFLGGGRYKRLVASLSEILVLSKDETLDDLIQMIIRENQDDKLECYAKLAKDSCSNFRNKG